VVPLRKYVNSQERETGETGGDSRLLRAVGSSAAGSEISE
jgi:hypothetical protein